MRVYLVMEEHPSRNKDDEQIIHAVYSDKDKAIEKAQIENRLAEGSLSVEEWETNGGYLCSIERMSF